MLEVMLPVFVAEKMCCLFSFDAFVIFCCIRIYLWSSASDKSATISQFRFPACDEVWWKQKDIGNNDGEGIGDNTIIMMMVIMKMMVMMMVVMREVMMRLYIIS